ncbi:hypothetical protein EV177_004507 [Coemansia sp. RSA 1804]|nr:hypothetical protein EV177_004507 [Coemansia sp. RSA 1804]
MDNRRPNSKLFEEGQLEKERRLRLAHRPSLTTSWSVAALDRLDENDSEDSYNSLVQSTHSAQEGVLHIPSSTRVRRTSSKAPDSPLPPPPLPYRFSPTQAQMQIQIPRQPVHRRLSHQTQPMSPLVPKPSTPQPLALRSREPEYSTENNFEMYKDASSSIHPAGHAKYLIDTTGDGDLEFREAPEPAHRAAFHRSANSLPINVPLISAPPLDSRSSVAPSAPPIPKRVPTFLSLDHARMPRSDSYRSRSNTSANDYSSVQAYNLSAEDAFADRSATSPEDIRRAAIQDASDNINRKMFSDKVLNFRDLGVSAIKAGLKLHQSWDKAKHEGPMPGVVFRSAELGSAYEHDVKMLFSKYGIRTIIDLRSELEARASDILIKHYPASIQPTADQSIERLMRLRAAQVRKTLVEVAAHSYETAAKPWERTGETQTSWSKRNSLKYSRSLGDPRRDPFARALAHLYDEASDQEYLDTENISRNHPYVPTIRLPPEAVEHPDSHSSDELQLQPLQDPSSDLSTVPGIGESSHRANSVEPAANGGPAQYPSLAQSAIDWGSDTLQVLRSYWDGSWGGIYSAGVHSRAAPTTPLPPRPQNRPYEEDSASSSTESPSYSYGSQPNDVLEGSDPSPPEWITHPHPHPHPQSLRKASNAATTSSNSSDDSFYKISDEEKARSGTRYGLQSVDRDAVDDIDRDSPQTLLRADTGPAVAFIDQQNGSTAAPMAQHHSSDDIPHSGANVSRMRSARVVKNRFSGERRRYRCNVIGENYRKKCVWASAPWSTKIKVILRFATFNKAEAIRTIGREVLAPRTLAGSYEDYVDYCKEEFAAVMRIFADPCAYPILFHCQHGKDRTGIVAMLLLGILGVDDQIIAADYARSEKNLVPVRQRMEMLDMGAVGLPPAFCDAPAPVMLNLLNHIRNSYGSVRGYLRSAGLKEQEINTIAWCLRGNFCGLVREETKRAHTESRRMYLRPSAARSDVFARPLEEESGFLPMHTANNRNYDARRGSSMTIEAAESA